MAKLKAENAARQAIDEVRRMLSTSGDGELATFRAFAEEFSAEVEGWEMRISELEDEESGE